MDGLSSTQRELVALGAALGSNCVPCIEYHIPEARKAGLSDRQINEAIRLADKVRKVPARKVLDTALDLLAEPAGAPVAEPAPGVAQPKHDNSPTDPQSTASDKACCG